MPAVTRLELQDASAGSQMDSADLQGLVRCFPGLHELHLFTVMKQDAGMAPLQQLSHLTALELENVRDTVAPAIAAPTGLQFLWIKQPSTITDLGLQQLTALTSLRELRAEGDFSTAVALEVDEDDGGDGKRIVYIDCTDCPPEVMMGLASGTRSHAHIIVGCSSALTCHVMSFLQQDQQQQQHHAAAATMQCCTFCLKQPPLPTCCMVYCAGAVLRSGNSPPHTASCPHTHAHMHNNRVPKGAIRSPH